MSTRDRWLIGVAIFLVAEGLVLYQPYAHDLIHWMEAWWLGSWFTYCNLTTKPR